MNVTSNTPSPPGTWLTSPATCASANAQSITPNVRFAGGLGSTAQSTATTSTQSVHAIAIWASAMRPDGGTNSHPRMRIGFRYHVHASRYATTLSTKSAPIGRSSVSGTPRNWDDPIGANSSDPPAIERTPSQNVTELNAMVSAMSALERPAALYRR